MKHLAAFLSALLIFGAATSNAKSLLENCTDNKLKEYKIKNLVTIKEEPALLRKFRADCAKTTFTTPTEKQALAAEAQAAERQALADKDAKAKEAKEKVEVKPIAPAPAAKSASTAPPAATTAGAASAPSTGNWAVIGGCGTPAQCEAYMREANTPKYKWSSPALQAYLGELWGNSLEQAYGLGGTFEQPESACSDSNQGQIIGLDLGTEVVAIACMSSMATQEEIKKMAAKIKTIKVETLVPTVIAVKRPKYDWKIIVEAKPVENQICICTHPGGCYSENVGRVHSEQSCCPTTKCVRTDAGGPVKPKSDKSKPATTAKTTDEPVKPVAPASTPAATSAPAATPAPAPMGYDSERDGAAGP